MSRVDEEEAEIIIGTYEDYVVGYSVEVTRKKLKTSNLQQNGTSNDRYSLEQSFAVRCHSGSVKSIAINENGSLAFSAGHDEMINLFSLKRRKLLQTLEGAYNCAQFVANKHLICASQGDDGNIHIYESNKNELTLVKTLKGHQAPILSMDVHPSGKVLLTLSKDNILRTWNLIKGRSAYVTNIRASNQRNKAHLLKWSKLGDRFIIAANNEVYLYNNMSVAIDSGQLEYFDLSNTSDEDDTEDGDDDDDDGDDDSDNDKTSQIQNSKCTSILKHEAHSVRIKCVKLLQEDDLAVRFVTASSDGVIKLWSFDKLAKPLGEQPKELASVDTGTRLTCMTTSIRKI